MDHTEIQKQIMQLPDINIYDWYTNYFNARATYQCENGECEKVVWSSQATTYVLYCCELKSKGELQLGSYELPNEKQLTYLICVICYN